MCTHGTLSVDTVPFTHKRKHRRYRDEKRMIQKRKTRNHVPVMLIIFPPSYPAPGYVSCLPSSNGWKIDCQILCQKVNVRSIPVYPCSATYRSGSCCENWPRRPVSGLFRSGVLKVAGRPRSLWFSSTMFISYPEWTIATNHNHGEGWLKGASINWHCLTWEVIHQPPAYQSAKCTWWSFHWYG